ncbi:unnamed protein product [Moneuplotes crassus]|uniref:Uncharacterized protein n=1 Tax=Euplotes crassus TaxID=5936 RepID=A0AAD1Y0B4_EUPCR|nr:unnamed protein product [Moneuplotes crassus]
MSEYLKAEDRVDQGYDFVKNFKTIDRYFNDDFIPEPREHKHRREIRETLDKTVPRSRSNLARKGSEELKKWKYNRHPVHDREIEEKLRFSREGYNGLREVEERNLNLINLLREKELKIEKLVYIIDVQKKRIKELEQNLMKIPQSQNDPPTYAPGLDSRVNISKTLNYYDKVSDTMKQYKKYDEEPFAYEKHDKIPTDHELRMKMLLEPVIPREQKSEDIEFNPYFNLSVDKVPTILPDRREEILDQEYTKLKEKFRREKGELLNKTIKRERFDQKKLDCDIESKAFIDQKLDRLREKYHEDSPNQGNYRIMKLHDLIQGKERSRQRERGKYLPGKYLNITAPPDMNSEISLRSKKTVFSQPVMLKNSKSRSLFKKSKRWDTTLGRLADPVHKTYKDASDELADELVKRQLATKKNPINEDLI